MFLDHLQMIISVMQIFKFGIIQVRKTMIKKGKLNGKYKQN
jgi:hypothetical protein